MSKMNNIIGPFSQTTWNTLRSLREAVREFTKEGNLAVAKKDKEIYEYFLESYTKKTA